MKANQKAIVKSVVIAAAGVMLAGFVMNQFRGNQIADRASAGFR